MSLTTDTILTISFFTIGFLLWPFVALYIAKISNFGEFEGMTKSDLAFGTLLGFLVCCFWPFSLVGFGMYSLVLALYKKLSK